MSFTQSNLGSTTPGNLTGNTLTTETYRAAQMGLVMQQLDQLDGSSGKGNAIKRIQSGLDANKPTGGTAAGTVYIATDTGVLYFDDGTDLDAVGTLDTAQTWTALQTMTNQLAVGGTAHGVVIGEGAATVVVTGAGTSGQVLTSNGASADPTFQASSSYKELGSGTATTNQSITSTSSPGTDVTSLSVTATPDGTHAVRVTVSLPNVGVASGSGNAVVAIQKDGVIVSTAVGAGNNFNGNISFVYRDQAPTNASHTYKVSAWITAAGTLNTINSGTIQNLILVEQIG